MSELKPCLVMEDSSTNDFLEIYEDYIQSFSEISTSTTALPSELKSTVKEVKVPAASSEVSTRHGESHDSVDKEQDVAVTETLPVYSNKDVSMKQHSDPTIKQFLHYRNKQQQPSQSDRRSESKATVALQMQWDRTHYNDGLLCRTVHGQLDGEVGQNHNYS